MQHAVALEWLVGWSDASSRFAPSKRAVLLATTSDSVGGAADPMAVDTEDASASRATSDEASVAVPDGSMGKAESDSTDGDTTMQPVPADEPAGSVVSSTPGVTDQTSTAANEAAASDAPAHLHKALETAEMGSAQSMPQLTAYELLLNMLTEPQIPIIVQARPRRLGHSCVRLLVWSAAGVDAAITTAPMKP
jgi:hypothetical protein